MTPKLLLPFLLPLLVPLQAAQGVLTDDATIQVQLPSNNFGGTPQIQAGGSASGLIRFSLADLPAGTTAAGIERATIRLFANRVTSPGNIEFSFIEFPWSEKTVTFATAPAKSSSTGAFSVTTANSFVTFDVTKLVQSALTAGLNSFGIWLAATGGTEVAFDSKESTATSQPAALDIQFVSIPGPVGERGAPGTNGTNGLTGPPGAQGLPGFTGPTGSSAVLGNLSSFQVADESVGSFRTGVQRLSCPAGYPTLVAGGCGTPFVIGSRTDGMDIKIMFSGPDTNAINTTWACHVINRSLYSVTVRTYVQCGR